MNHKNARLRAFAATTSILGLLGIVSVGGCSDVAGALEGCDKDFTAEAQWGANLDIDTRVKSFMGASGALVTLSTAMVNDVTDACVGIATATKRDAKKWEPLEGADRLKMACDEANLGMDEVLKANANISIGLLVEGGGCEVNLGASATCNAKCDVTGKCTPAQLEAKCEPGQLAGTCSAQCSGSCTAKAGATVACDGACSAACTGTCTARAGTTGKCSSYDMNGNCTGRCDGDCAGTCSGTCDVKTGASVQCDGSCRGECTVALTAPRCEGKLTPPECDLDVDCESSCRAQVQAEAVCTPPTVKIEVNGGASADFTALVGALETHLPRLIQNIGVRGEATLDAANTLVTVGQHLDDAITSSGKAFVCTTLAATASLNASIEVKVSVEASASVGGRAAGTTAP